ncbi:hypothetical protein PF011_g32450 [Phytophthora fragariae]|uniref:Uncharacterized protein n=1 Tax=Phytophthora fragariae TaxID=53985 RepID=A0A6A3G981_9STRA|nr:hypothetical protein PF011_g32450 [Phytophthora fragariae]
MRGPATIVVAPWLSDAAASDSGLYTRSLRASAGLPSSSLRTMSHPCLNQTEDRNRAAFRGTRLRLP